MDPTTTPRSASLTALGVARLRAAHQLLDGATKILDDPISLRLLGPDTEARIRAEIARFEAEPSQALRAHVVLRSRFAEDRLALGAARGVSQCVILGAGLDTFAYRQPRWAAGLQIFEIDHAASQAVKRSMLRDAGIEIPANVHFGAVDFEREPLIDALSRSNVSLEQKTFFSWLGVTMYLHEDAIDAVLRTVAQFPPDSEIVFTFRNARNTMSALAERAAELGEPWVSAFEPAALERKLRDVGFRHVEFLDPRHARAHYFAHSSLPAPRLVNTVAAIR
jgi:methyltransferase (TIGR00027 family)